jgi:protein-S-isoprenylcysteine O-methyltransferase Ste14
MRNVARKNREGVRIDYPPSFMTAAGGTTGKIGFWKEAGSVAPTAVFMLAGIAVSVHDFIHLHHKVFQTPGVEIGAFLICLGLILEMVVRLILVDRAGFGSLAETKRLLITHEHHLITNGVFRWIRHPLYLGRITLDFGIALLFSSP